MGSMPKLEELYRDAPFLQRLLVAHRHRICPTKPILAHIPDGRSILDVGCGVGFFLITFALNRNIRSGVGFDVNESAVSVARRAARSLCDVDLRFHHQSSVRELELGPFEVVTVIDVMHHIPVRDQERFFAECADAVAPMGRLVYKDMAQKPMWMSLWNRFHDLVLARQVIHYVPLETIKQWGADRGLKLVHEEKYARYAYAHELLVFERAA